MMPNADAIALGKQIKAVRKAMKMTQEQLALKSNVSVKYIANIENGKQNPSFDILSSILHVLPLSLDSDRKSTRLNSSHNNQSRMPSSA